MVKATVSGSFHRHMAAIYDAVGELRIRGVDVLSPSDPRVVDNIGEFLFVASDRLRSIKLVQDRHFEAIRHSDFLWVVCPDGYTGASTSAEIGAAYMAGVPVYANAPALDITLQQYVTRVATYDEAIALAGRRRRAVREPHVLLDPVAVLGTVHGVVENLQPLLLGQSGDKDGDAQRALDSARDVFSSSFNLRN